MTDTCLFCRIARGEIPATVVAESTTCLAFRDINAQAPSHVLVIPRAHYESLDALHDAALASELLGMARAVAETEGIARSGYRVVINTGTDGGQSVFHLHLHVLGGRYLAWPPG
jgi:histidine triad (HIT) family protein